MERKDDDDGYTSGDGFDDNTQLADPHYEGYDERTEYIYEDDAMQPILGGHPENHYSNWLPFDAYPP